MRDLNIAGRDVNTQNSSKENKLFWWVMGIIGTIIASLAVAWLMR